MTDIESDIERDVLVIISVFTFLIKVAAITVTIGCFILAYYLIQGVI